MTEGEANSRGTRGGTITQAGELRSARLESIRALAALGVMTGHIFGQAHHYANAQTLDTFVHRILFGGGYGVFVFFGLTGYLLFWPFARQWFGAGAAIDLRRYAINRALRILPLYYAVVILLLVLQHGGGSLSQWWRFATFSENFSTHTVTTVDGPLWSLVVEVQFYILLPFLAWGLARLARRSRFRAGIILLALAVMSYFVRRHAVGAGGRRILLELSLPATFMYFVVGMLVALLRLEWEERRPRWLRGPLAIADLWLAAAVVLVVVEYYYYTSVPIAFATFLALGACVLPLRRGALVRGLDWRPLAVVGVASYSLYVWHNPIVIELSHLGGIPHSYAWQLPIASVVCVAVALVSYRLIEAPFLRLRRQWSPAAARNVDEHGEPGARPIAAGDAGTTVPAASAHEPALPA